MLGTLELTLCKMQGNLFVMAARQGYSSESFIKAFMHSATAKDLDKEFSYMQWAGEAYLLSRLEDEDGDKLEKGGEVYDDETLLWAGYLYRYWHYYTGESSKQIIKQASAKTMRTIYLMYHTMSPELAIRHLKETHEDKS